MKTMLYLVRALTGVDIYVSAVTMMARGAEWQTVMAFIFGVVMMVFFLIADGAIGTWRQRRDEEEEIERRRAMMNRDLTIRTMLDPIDPDRVFPADRGERKKEEDD